MEKAFSLLFDRMLTAKQLAAQGSYNAPRLKGEKRPADVIGNAVHVMRIATGEIEENRVRVVSCTPAVRHGN